MKNLYLRTSFFLAILCTSVMVSLNAFSQAPRFGNGYENLSRRTTGGKIRSGDTIDIKMAIHIPWGYNGGSTGKIFKVRFLDSIPSKTTMLIASADSIRILTNEDLTYSRFTPAAGDDAATYIAAPSAGNYQVRINLGASPGAPASTSITDVTGADKINLTSNWPYGTGPKWYTGHIFSTSFRVKVTGNTGDTIRLTGGVFVYRLSDTGPDIVIKGQPYQMLIGADDQLCSGALGVNYAGEFGGTFGSGTTLNRAGGPSVLVSGYGYVSNMSGSTPINDGNYGIVNNVSPTGSTNRTALRIPNCNPPVVAPADSCKNRMFGGNWEIEGDHTGSSGKWGNSPPAPGTSGGYMLLVNADYITSSAYQNTISSLCPDTYYQFSAWFRNVCRTCGADKSITNTYKPGVLPSLTFSVDGVDMYSTGELDTTGWVQKAFLFKTGASQSSAVFAIRNNSQGGGGNDWAIDDISISTCGPPSTFNYQPMIGCKDGTLAKMADTVSYSYNGSYSWYKWERSLDNGATWQAPLVPATGQAAPVLINGKYQFITNYPPFVAYAADSGHLYRVLMATTQVNLSNSGCSFADGNSILLKLLDCGHLLNVNLIYFSGQLDYADKPALKWMISSEEGLQRYEIERSADGLSFFKVGEVMPQMLARKTEYAFNDITAVANLIYFRLKVIGKNGAHSYSKVVVLRKSENFRLLSLLNPFHSEIETELFMPKEGVVKMKLLDNLGKLLVSENRKLYKGLNRVTYSGFGNLSPGVYIISLEDNYTSIQRKISKTF